ncbi:MAG: malate synthase [Actinomycetia bacterium]|nr:malate synthase [Actinomycetes bacterium]
MAQPPERVRVAELSIDAELHRFVEEEVLDGLDIDPADVWAGLDDLVHHLGPQNRSLLERRAELQAAIDHWHRQHTGEPHDLAAYQAFLTELGYLVPAGPAFTIETSGIDAEIAEVAGPQLVVPVTNARYALNAANARWGSLYDALYGTDALGDSPAPGPYDPARGARVVAWVRALLDEVVPLERGSHADVARYRVEAARLVADRDDGTTVGLADAAAFAGHAGDPTAPSSVLLRHHGLHLELVVDRDHPVGRDDTAGVADVLLESAVTTIVDFEDSVATVDAADKVAAYRNWLGLMRGDLTAEVPAASGTKVRRLEADRHFTAPDGSALTVPGRALLLVRNVGLLLSTDAVLDRDGQEVPEGLLDALVTVLIALHDLGARRSSRAGSVYVVKPKLHGPDEVAFTDAVFARVEAILGLPANTVKIGLMDEERRTSVNLQECIRAARHRLAFVNTGFLDRTGDEIHTSMEAGPVVPKARMKREPWFLAYEDRNVAIGLACGLRGRAQIGKGMWAAPDRMADMLADKVAHPAAGANCAWVPSPTAATLHATHYHRVDVGAVQAGLLGAPVPAVDDLLRPPVGDPASWPADEVLAELENNAQGILGYVVRWIDQGVGCSKVPDIHDVGLMEDRATCRISSQHLANWLRHGVLDAEEVGAALVRMAAVVDRQNDGDPAYRSLVADPDGPAFRAASELVFSGAEQPSGYTEPILHARRRERKARVEVTT